MTDNVIVSPASGPGGATVATDDINGVQHQRVKVTLGTDGVSDGDVSTSNPMPVSARFSDSEAIDAFGRLRVSESNTQFESQQEYGLDTLRNWDITANGVFAAGSSNGSVSSGGNLVGPTDSNTRLTPITVSGTNGHYSIMQSRQYVRYIPGKSHLVLLTGVFASGSGATTSIVLRSKASGSVVDTEVAQENWNVDNFDGLGPSGVTLDFTKTQILYISAQWLGVGRVVVGFDVDGVLFPAHYFLNANNLSVPYTQTYNLPVRMEIRNETANTSQARVGYFDADNGVFLKTSRGVAGGTIYFNCCSVQSEGGQTARGYPFTAPASVSTVAVTTRRPVMSIRPKLTFNGRVNRAHINEIQAYIKATTNDALYEIVIGGELTGASFSSVNANSSAEIDVSATAITGGVPIYADFVTSGSGSKGGAAGADADFRNPLVLSKIDSLTATQPIISIVCTSVSGTSNIASGMNWHEIST